MCIYIQEELHPGPLKLPSASFKILIIPNLQPVQMNSPIDVSHAQTNVADSPSPYPLQRQLFSEVHHKSKEQI